MEKGTFISSMSPYPEEEYYLGKSSWSGNASDWDQRFEVGDVIADPSGSWTPGTAEQYIDQQVATLNSGLAQEAIARQTGDNNLSTQLTSEMNTRADQDANLNALINAGIREGGGVQFDIVPTQNSANGITSGGMYSTLRDSNIGFVDDVPTVGSNNLVKSGGVAGYVSVSQNTITEGDFLAKINIGEDEYDINSSIQATKTPQIDVCENDFAVSDEKGNTIFTVKNGYPETKHFKGSELYNYKDAPLEGFEYFTYNVDVANNNVENNIQSTSIIDEVEISEDTAFISFPTTYSKWGKPTRLLLLNHGAGVVINDLYSDYGDLITIFNLEGYAVLNVYGVPLALRSKYVSNGTGWGSPISLRSVYAAYKYVVEKYNIAKDGVMMWGGSMGGLTTCNLVNSGLIPVKLIGLDAPVLSLYQDGYFSWGLPLNTMYMYQFDYCDWENDTYTLPAGTYIIDGSTITIEQDITDDLSDLPNNSNHMKVMWYLNKQKTIGYDPYLNSDSLYKNLDSSYYYNSVNDNGDSYFGKALNIPVKIWFGTNDLTNQVQVARRYINKIRNAQNVGILREVPVSNHTVNNVKRDANNNDISVTFHGLSVSPFLVEMVNWFNRYK